MTSTPNEAGQTGAEATSGQEATSNQETTSGQEAAGAAGGSVDTGIEPWLRDILRCPNCRSELADAQGEAGPELHCTSAECGLQYRIDDGVPVLLVDEARKPA